MTYDSYVEAWEGKKRGRVRTIIHQGNCTCTIHTPYTVYIYMTYVCRVPIPAITRDLRSTPYKG